MTAPTTEQIDQTITDALKEHAGECDRTFTAKELDRYGRQKYDEGWRGACEWIWQKIKRGEE